MAASLLIGNILLVAIAVSHPMYQAASRNRMLTDEFANYMKDNNSYPMIIDVEGLIRKSAGISDTKRIRDFANTAAEQFGVPETEKVCVRGLVSSVATPTAMFDRNSSELKLVVGSMSDLEKHSSIVSGRMYSDAITEDGYVEAIISQSAMTESNLLIGEEMYFKSIKYAEKDNLKIRIVGVFTNSEDNDNYWVKAPNYYDNYLMINPGLFEQGFMANNTVKYNVNEH